MKKNVNLYCVFINKLLSWLHGARTSERCHGLLKKYLTTVYPTSHTLTQMNVGELENYYSKLNYFYRLPLKKNKFSGILSTKVKTIKGVFFHPDTIAVKQQTFTDDFVGFTDSHTYEGSNNQYIEVSCFGFVQFPFGGYYNWAKGSGIYVKTRGKTIAGYTKLNIIYDILKGQNKEQDFFDTLLNNAYSLAQIIGLKTIPENFFREILTDPIDPKYLSQHVAAIGDIPTLLSGLYSSNEWKKICQHVAQLNDNRLVLYYLLKNYYVPDHFDGSTYRKLENNRYMYILAEVNGNLAEQDRWLYTVTKAMGYKIIQASRQPNRTKNISFEVMDTRWPMVTIKESASSSIQDGIQNYDIAFVWRKIISQRLFSLRDPYDLNNDKKAIPLEKISLPALSTKFCNQSYVQPPPDDFDPNFLPPLGWSKQACSSSYGTFPSDTIFSWLKGQTCPLPLNKYLRSCQLVNYALDASLQRGFSVLDPQSNVQKLRMNGFNSSEGNSD